MRACHNPSIPWEVQQASGFPLWPTLRRGTPNLKASFRGGSEASEPGISRFRVRAGARPGMTSKALLQVDNPAHVAVELHAAKCAALVEIADPIRRQFRLLGKNMFAKILGPAGRSVTPG